MSRVWFWFQSGAKTLNQSLSEVLQNQSNSLITLDSQLKTTLKLIVVFFFKLMNVRGHPVRMEPIARFLRMGTAVSLALLDGREKTVMKV